jgi:hypothetical protein
VLRVHLEQILGKQQTELRGLASNSAIFEGSEEKYVREESHTKMCNNSLGKKFQFIWFLTTVFQVMISQLSHTV